MFWEKFIRLCTNKGKKPSHVIADLNLAAGSVTKWKNGASPNATTLQKLADYFGVPVSYFTNETEKAPTDNLPEEAVKVALFGGDTEVTPEMWDEVLKFAAYAKEKYGKK